jgi:hypothetical protein
MTFILSIVIYYRPADIASLVIFDSIYSMLYVSLIAKDTAIFIRIFSEKIIGYLTCLSFYEHTPLCSLLIVG